MSSNFTDEPYTQCLYQLWLVYRQKGEGAGLNAIEVGIAIGLKKQKALALLNRIEADSLATARLESNGSGRGGGQTKVFFLLRTNILDSSNVAFLIEMIANNSDIQPRVEVLLKQSDSRSFAYRNESGELQRYDLNHLAYRLQKASSLKYLKDSPTNFLNREEIVILNEETFKRRGYLQLISKVEHHRTLTPEAG